jgi:hypothetical protein
MSVAESNGIPAFTSTRAGGVAGESAGRRVPYRASRAKPADAIEGRSGPRKQASVEFEGVELPW